MIIGRQITQQMGLAVENKASGSPGQEKKSKNNQTKVYFGLFWCKSVITGERASTLAVMVWWSSLHFPTASKYPVWSSLDFPGFLKHELLFDLISVRFYESKGEAVTHHRSCDRLKITRGVPSRLSASMLSEVEAGAEDGGLWPGERDSQRWRLERRTGSLAWIEGFLMWGGLCRLMQEELESAWANSNSDLWTWRVRRGL